MLIWESNGNRLQKTGRILYHQRRPEVGQWQLAGEEDREENGAGKAWYISIEKWKPKRLDISTKTPSRFTSNVKAFFLKAVRALPGSLTECLHTCANKIKVCLFPAWVSVLKICFTASFVNQRVRWKDAKYLQKSVSWIWQECRKALPLHPQSREMRQWLKYW